MESARAMFRVEALEGNEAIFLATHSPILGFTIGGASGDEILEPTEQALLEAISRPEIHHAFCVVEGEPGSGKSHLIRWLYVNWPKGGRDRPLLLQRSDGSLEGALAQLQEKLPAEFKELFDGLGTKQKVGEAGRARTFHSNLRQSLRPDHYETPLKDNAWCERWHPSELLRPDNVEEQWDAPRRILRLVSGKEGERNSESARFNIFDIYELQELVNRSDLKSPKSLSLHANLVGESVEIEEARSAGLEADQIVREFGAKIPNHVAFAGALNGRRNDAIQHVIGVSSDSLKKLFREIRRALRTKGIRLVLLLEDITSWEGLDDSLIDVLTTNADTRSDDAEDRDQCDLVSVVGLTPDYYDTTLRTNYQDRITHKVSLGEGEHGLQDVAMMRDPADRLRFVGRYLAATRAGTQLLGDWRDELRLDATLVPPNPCETCPLVHGCHVAFGHVDGIGLYPFTERALDGFFGALKEQGERRTWKTPRGLIQAILSPTLRQPDLLGEGAYPGANVEVAAFDQRTRYAPAALDRLLHARSDDEAERERLRRTITFWGAAGDLQTTIETDGQIAFHGVPRTVYEAFHLPWLGGEPGEAIVAPAPPAPAAPAPVENEPDKSQPQSGGDGETGRMGAEPSPAPAPRPSPPAQPSRAPRLRLDAANITQWRKEGGKLQNPNEWNEALYLIASTIDPRVMGYDGWVWNRLIQPTTLKIEGTATARRDLLILPAKAWLQEGLEAYAGIEADPAALPDMVEYRQARLARMLRHLRQEIRDYIDRTLGETDVETIWSPAIAAAQILLVRAWLRGVVLPTASPAEQWVALLRDEGAAESAPAARTAKWQNFLNSTAQQHASLRTLLRDSLSLPQGASREFGLASGVAAAAIVDLIKGLGFRDTPHKVLVHTEARKLIETAAELVTKARDLLPTLIIEERRRLSERSARLLEQLRGCSLRAHGERLDIALDAASKALPGTAADKMRDWKAMYDAVRVPLADDARALEETLVQFGLEGEDSSLDEPRNLLAALITAQAAPLENVGNAFTAGEAAVTLMAGQAAATIAQAGPVAGLETIREQGAALVAGCNQITGLLDSAGGQ
jgi:hypothetical protein